MRVIDGRRILEKATCLAVLTALLQGCMTLGDHPAPPPPTVSAPPADLRPPDEAPAVPPRPQPRPPVKKSAPAPRKDARSEPAPAAVDPQSLIGLDQAGVRHILGPPKQVKSDHLSQSWVYDAPGCSVRVIFYPSLDNASFRALKLASVNSKGEPLDASDACVNHLLIARSNAH